MNWLMDLIFNKIARSLDGYKTTIGAIGLILTGVTGLIGHYWPDTGIPAMPVDSALMTISGGFAAFGLGSKVEKLVQK